MLILFKVKPDDSPYFSKTVEDAPKANDVESLKAGVVQPSLVTMSARCFTSSFWKEFLKSQKTRKGWGTELSIFDKGCVTLFAPVSLETLIYNGSLRRGFYTRNPLSWFTTPCKVSLSTLTAGGAVSQWARRTQGWFSRPGSFLKQKKIGHIFFRSPVKRE